MYFFKDIYAIAYLTLRKETRFYLPNKHVLIQFYITSYLLKALLDDGQDKKKKKKKKNCDVPKLPVYMRILLFMNERRSTFLLKTICS